MGIGWLLQWGRGGRRQGQKKLHPIPSAFEITVPSLATGTDAKYARLWYPPFSSYFDQGQVVFSFSNQRLTSRILEGQYPAYRQLIPVNSNDKLAWASAVAKCRAVAVLADQKNNIVKFSIDSVNQELSVEAQDVGSGRNRCKHKSLEKI